MASAADAPRMGSQEQAMSQLKRDTSHFRFAHADKPATTPRRDQDSVDSQPNQTLELQGTAALRQRSDGPGSDPYNAVGVRMKRSKAV
jgi:hypothetical protein